MQHPDADPGLLVLTWRTAENLMRARGADEESIAIAREGYRLGAHTAALLAVKSIGGQMKWLMDR